jgi:fatty acid desaturase
MGTNLLRFKVDRWSLLVVVGVLAFQLAAAVLNWSAWLLLPLLIMARQVNLVEHNHAHLRMFHARSLNEVLGWMCFMSNGVPLEFYEVHHVKNHHTHNNGSGDWSSIFAFSGCRYPDKPVSLWRYILTFPSRTIRSSLVYILGHRSGRMYRRFRRSLTIIVLASGVVATISPAGFATFFLVPWTAIFFGLGLTSHRHHHGCEFTSAYDSSNVMFGPFVGVWGFHIGLHASHHIKPALHWSLLPEHHASIEHLIPASNFKPRGAGAGSLSGAPSFPDR